MIYHRISGVPGRSFAFTLLETLVMLVTVVAFTLLLLGVTKPLWKDKSAIENNRR
jgi:hypothetical protein